MSRRTRNKENTCSRGMPSCQLAEASSVGRYPTTSQASAVAAKAQFDKFVLDKAEEKAEFDRALEHSVQEAAAQKAVADNALLDMGEMEVSLVRMSMVLVQNAHGSGRVRVARHSCVRRAPAVHAQEVGHKETRRQDGCAASCTRLPCWCFWTSGKYMGWRCRTRTSLKSGNEQGTRHARLSAR